MNGSGAGEVEQPNRLPNRTPQWPSWTTQKLGAYTEPNTVASFEQKTNARQNISRCPGKIPSGRSEEPAAFFVTACANGKDPRTASAKVGSFRQRARLWMWAAARSRYVICTCECTGCGDKTSPLRFLLVNIARGAKLPAVRARVYWAQAGCILSPVFCFSHPFFLPPCIQMFKTLLAAQSVTFEKNLEGTLERNSGTVYINQCYSVNFTIPGSMRTQKERKWEGGENQGQKLFIGLTSSN